MTRFQRVFCVFLCLCFFGALAILPGPFSLWEIWKNVYRQFPLYYFLEEKAVETWTESDEETIWKMAEANGTYLVNKYEALEGAGDTEENNSRKAGENGQVQKNSEAVGETGVGRSDEADEGVEEERNSEIVEESEEKLSGKADEGSEEKINDETDEEAEKRKSGKTVDDAESSNASDTSNINDTRDTESVTGEKKNSEKTQLSEWTKNSETAGEAEKMKVMETLADYDSLLRNFYIVDENTDASAVRLDAEEFLKEDFSLKKESQKPQILIYHSHSQETFADSVEGVEEDTIVGVGNYLTKLLQENYGYQVIHVKEKFDLMGGELDRSKAYDYSREYVEKVLKENPSIEVLIDLHRDGVADDRRLVTEINGRSTAQILFYNGLSYTNTQGKISYLPNPYLQDNLAFSFQLEYQAALYYPSLYRGIYLAGLRYNLHLRKRAVLLEAGAQTNTVQEVKNAMEPFADILNRVLEHA